MYRAITWLALSEGVDTSDESTLQRVARSTSFALAADGRTLLVNGMPAEAALRSAEVDAAVSAVSAHPAVRAEMVQRQREVAHRGCIVVIGRDIGTVVLPDAPVKLWITASPAERARRRLAEALPGSRRLTENEMEARIVQRDERDAGRAVSPLRQASDAVPISTDGLSPEETVLEALTVVRRALGADLAGEHAGKCRP
jgi:cytidylate kinase